MPKLYEIPKGSKLRLEVTNKDGVTETLFATFHHLDGMYSLCTFDDAKSPDDTLHLHRSTPLKLVNGYYEISD